MSSFHSIRRDWFSNPRGDILSGILVALALIPEAIGFSIIAGVDPRVGLYASFSIAVIIALVGGRPAMISAATAAIAVLVVPLVRDHGIDYLFAATILMGILQVVAGFLRLDLLMQYVSRSVITGFVNALAILIFMAQLPQLIDVTPITYVLVAVALAIIYILPRFTRVVPSPLIAIIVLTAFTISQGTDVNTVGDMGALPDSLPAFLLPDVPLTLETLQIIFPYSLAMAAVGLLESMLTAQIVDEMTDTPSGKRREIRGQGIANFITGFFGGMGGCAMIGQSVINVKAGGRTRLSTMIAGLFLLFLLVVLGPLVAQIPMPSLVAVMIMVSIGTFNWRSVGEIRTNPWQSSVVMLTTVAIVVWTHNLAAGVIAGVLLSGIFFASKVKRMFAVDSEKKADGTRVYTVSGAIFFASSERFVAAFDFQESVSRVIIDVTHAHFWDITSIGVLDKVVAKFRNGGISIEIVGLNEASAMMVERFATYDKPGTMPLPIH
ncbi:SulP family inorganic anion transporter [Limoniibacter endophyticus]|uniref:Sodium-independent anion transporter n=1 Tax=Limoniibacter endophyticus TaxID=1565040 RepID=A0A8J3DJI7_9HYPH|nr:SulP family inorganic anion transporter [Limoniibacter endophyticus]GHC78691.1 sodium-independent anion transporter [Limoniibacter endophyticus]